MASRQCCVTSHGTVDCRCPQVTLQDLHLQVSGFGMPRTEVQLAAQWTPSRVDLTRLHVRQPQSELRAQGHVTLPEQQVQFRLDIPRLHTGQQPLSLPPTLPPVMQGTLTVRGHLQAPEVEALLQYAGGADPRRPVGAAPGASAALPGRATH